MPDPAIRAELRRQLKLSGCGSGVALREGERAEDPRRGDPLVAHRRLDGARCDRGRGGARLVAAAASGRDQAARVVEERLEVRVAGIAGGVRAGGTSASPASRSPAATSISARSLRSDARASSSPATPTHASRASSSSPAHRSCFASRVRARRRAVVSPSSSATARRIGSSCGRPATPSRWARSAGAEDGRLLVADPVRDLGRLTCIAERAVDVAEGEEARERELLPHRHEDARVGRGLVECGGEQAHGGCRGVRELRAQDERLGPSRPGGHPATSRSARSRARAASPARARSCTSRCARRRWSSARAGVELHRAGRELRGECRRAPRERPVGRRVDRVGDRGIRPARGDREMAHPGVVVRRAGRERGVQRPPARGRHPLVDGDPDRGMGEAHVEADLVGEQAAAPSARERRVDVGARERLLEVRGRCVPESREGLEHRCELVGGALEPRADRGVERLRQRQARSLVRAAVGREGAGELERVQRAAAGRLSDASQEGLREGRQGAGQDPPQRGRRQRADR